MRVLQPAAWVVAGLACGAIAGSEADVVKDASDKIESALKDGVAEDKMLASVSLPDSVGPTHEVPDITSTMNVADLRQDARRLVC